jgi:hypothetical protein
MMKRDKKWKGVERFHPSCWSKLPTTTDQKNHLLKLGKRTNICCR